MQRLSPMRLLSCMFLMLCIAPAVPAIDSDGRDAVSLAEFASLADGFRRHCVKVFIHLTSHRGETTDQPGGVDNLQNERPTLTGGYWWTDRYVILADPMIQDHHIRAVEVGQPFSERRYPARVAGRFVKLQATLLEVLPDEDGSLPNAQPLELVDGDADEGLVLSYGWNEGDWRISANRGLSPPSFTDSGPAYSSPGGNGILVSPDGGALGLAFGSKLPLGDQASSWSGLRAALSPLLLTVEAERRHADLRERLRQAVPTAHFLLRVRHDDDDDSWSGMSGEDASLAEIRVPALVVGKHHLLAPLPLGAESIARIEEITLRLADGRDIAANFAAALRDYKAVLLDVEEELPQDAVPAGFSLLNPLVMPDEAFQPGDSARPEQEYLIRWQVEFVSGRRRETVDYDRWRGLIRGYRDDPVVWTFSNEEEGALAFDLRGRLAAVALTPRPAGSSEVEPVAGFIPVDHLYRRFHGADVFDPLLVPVDEDEGRRLVDFGVEYQKLDENTARLFQAGAETRGGRIGMLVNCVYPGLAADKLGLQEQDILLRLYLPDRGEPVELIPADGDSASSGVYAFEDMTLDSIRRLMSMFSPPWPSRENTLSVLLTATGVGKTVVLEYLREGEMKRAEFVTAYADPDFRNAKKQRFPGLGLTVKPLTYEVKRFFHRTDDSGVVISRVEEGGRAAVSGLHPYLLITHVNGEKIDSAQEFRTCLEPLESGEAASVELTIEGFGKTRLVKIE